MHSRSVNLREYKTTKIIWNTIFEILQNLKSQKEIESFFSEIFTQSELKDLVKRWRIMELLAQGETQREIASNLNVSLCKVTRGAKILKNKNAITTKFLIKE